MIAVLFDYQVPVLTYLVWGSILAAIPSILAFPKTGADGFFQRSLTRPERLIMLSVPLGFIARRRVRLNS
jgi:hypothetical protein